MACANFARLEDDIAHLAAAGVDYLHIDFMDGRFVPNFGLDYDVLRTIRRLTGIPLDCHLMIEEPERYIVRTAQAGAEYIAIHLEATRHVQKALREIRELGAKSAIALNPATPIACLDYFLDDIDMVTIMTVNPGFAGQSLGPAMIRTIQNVSRRLQNAGCDHVEIQVDGNVSFENIPAMVAADRAVTFPLHLRIPGWCQNPSLTINGRPVPASRASNGFVTVRRTFAPGDTVTLTFPLELAVTRWPQQSIGIERGPLVYSLPIKERWSTRVEPQYTTPDYPDWEALPQSPFNYGLALVSADLDRQILVRKRALPERLPDPWEHPPIALELAARRIPGWDLVSSPDKPQQQFTPCQPDTQTRAQAAAPERITLVPYGATHLRLTIFPELPPEQAAVAETDLSGTQLQGMLGA